MSLRAASALMILCVLCGALGWFGFQAVDQPAPPARGTESTLTRVEDGGVPASARSGGGQSAAAEIATVPDSGRRSPPVGQGIQGNSSEGPPSIGVTARGAEGPLTEFTLLVTQMGAHAPDSLRAVEGVVHLSPRDLPCRVMVVSSESFSDIVEIADPADCALETRRLVDVHGTVRDAVSDEPVAGVTVALSRVDIVGQWRDAAAAAGLQLSRTAGSEATGDYVLPGVPDGTYELTATASTHDAATVVAAGDVAPLIRLTPRRAVDVHLHGVDMGTPDAYFVGTSPTSARYPVDRGGTGRLLLEAGAPGPDVTVFFPDDTELTAIFMNPPQDLSAGLDVTVGGGELATVTLHGEVGETERLILCVQFTSALGYDVFATRWIVPGEPEQLKFCEPGVAWFDATLRSEDGTLRALARQRVELRAGVHEHVALELSGHRCYLRFVDASGAALTEGEVYLATPADSHLTPVGGQLDTSGRALVPFRDETALHLIGSLGPLGAALVDVPVDIDARHTDERSVDVGTVQRASVTIVENGQPVASRWFDLVGPTSGLIVANLRTGEEGAPAEVAWYSAGTGALRFDGADVWSPRELVPLTPGEHRIELVRRAHCTFRTRGRAVVDIRHMATGMQLAALLTHDGVRTEEIPGGRRMWGPPCGAFEVRLEGEDAWRGPFSVGPGDWVIVDVEE